jgi:hypothetical protein
MQENLWGERVSRPRRKRKVIPLTSAAPYAVTDNDCEILGHTLREWDLAGCNICTDCGVKIFCPRCTSSGHPQDASAIAILCERHEEPQESQVSA